MNPHSVFKRASGIPAFSLLLIAAQVILIIACKGFSFERLCSGYVVLAIAATAAGACMRASCRSLGEVRVFWFLLGCTATLWSLGQGLYLFNEFYLYSPNLNSNSVLFVFFVSFIPLSLAVLCRVTNEAEGAQWLTWFDRAQVVGIALAACLLNYDLVLGKNAAHALHTRLFTLHARNLILAMALLLRTLLAKGVFRRLYAYTSLFLSFFAISTWVGNQALEFRGLRTGDWSDLCWSIPFAILSISASHWHSPTVLCDDSPDCRNTPFAEYLLPGLLSLFLVGVALKGIELQREIALTLIFGSSLCYFFRSSLAQSAGARATDRLRSMLENTKRLTGYLPLCAACKMIRNENGGWEQMESYLRKYTEAEFTHGICPDCAHRLYPEHVSS